MALSVGVTGACGAMGQALVQAVIKHDNLALTAVLERKGHPDIGQDIGSLYSKQACGVVLAADDAAFVAETDAVIDFSFHSHTAVLAGLIAERGSIHIIGTTGFTPEEQRAIDKASSSCVIVQAANMSIGVNVLRVLVERAARALSSCDISVLDIHHRRKKDAPSGTAFLLAQSVTKGTGRQLEREALVSMRGGDAIGSHSVMFFGEGERLELIHHAQDRAIYVQGALRAALWAQDKPYGLYDMTDVFKDDVA